MKNFKTGSYFSWLKKSISRNFFLIILSLTIIGSSTLVDAQCPLVPSACTGTPVSGSANVTIPAGATYYIPLGQTLSGSVTFGANSNLCIEGTFTGTIPSFPLSGSSINVYGTINSPSASWSFASGGANINIYPGASVIIKEWITNSGTYTLNNCGTFITVADIVSYGGTIVINNYNIVNVNGTLDNHNPSFTFNNKVGATMYVAGSFTFAGGLYVNDGDFCVVVNTWFSAGLFLNNGCLRTTDYTVSGSNSFTNNKNIKVEGNYWNAGQGTYNNGNIDVIGNYKSTAPFTMGDGSLLTCVDWENRSLLYGPNTGCGSVRASGITSNYSTFNITNSSRIDIKDAGNPTPVGSPPAALDINTGNVNAATFTGACTPNTYPSCALACIAICVDVPNAGPDQTACATTATLAGNTPVIGKGTWKIVSGTGVITTPTNPASGVTGLGVGANKFVWSLSCDGSSDTVVITRVGNPTTAAAGPDQALCNVTTATLAGNTVTTGAGTWTLISGSGTITTPSSPTSGLTGLGIGANVFRWTTSNPPCAATTDDVTITVKDIPTVATAGADQSVCSTGATLTGNTPTVGIGTWTLISGTGTIATPTSPTSSLSGLGVGANVFRWTISNPPCASTFDEVTINVSANPSTANAGTDQTLCNVTTSTLAGVAPTSGTGSWSVISGGATVTSPLLNNSGVTGLSIGANVFRWTINGGACANLSDDVTITVKDIPTTATAGPDQSLCATTTTLAGDSAIVGTGTWTRISGSGTISNPSSPTSGVTGLGVGTNVFRWTISNSPCTSSTDDVTINVSGIPTTANAGPDQTICVTTATLAANNPTTGTGTWTLVSGSGTITTPTSRTSGVTGLVVGTSVFRWTVSNPPCSSSVDEVSITISPNPSAPDAGPDQTVCSSVTTVPLAGNTPLVGVGTWTLVSGSGSITSPNIPNTDVTGLVVGANVFRWTIHSGACTDLTDEVTITVSAPVTINAATTNVGCYGNTTGSIDVTVAGGTAPYTYTWSGSQKTEDITGLTAGTYTVSVTDKSGCVNQKSITITQPASALQLTGVVNKDVSCKGSKDGSATVNVTGGTPNYTYLWTPPGSTSATASGLSGNTYTVTVTDNTGCTSTTTVTVKESTTAFTAGVTNVKNVTCKGSKDGIATTTPVGGTIPYTFAWAPTGGTSQTASGLSGATYTVTVSDVYGCDTVLTVKINESTLALTTSILAVDASCSNNDGSVTLTATGGTTPFSYQWSSPATATSSVISGVGRGTYTVTVTDLYGCTATQTATVNAPPSPVAGFTPSPTSGTNPLTVNFTNNSTGGTIYKWNFGDSIIDSTFNTTHIYDNPGKYTVKLIVINSFGCIDSVTYTFIKVNQKSVISIPNVFTPNGDNLNDVFYVTSKGLLTLEVEIYNRWGMKLHEFNTVNGGWDGRNAQGSEVPDGTYYFILRATGEDDVDYNTQGFISLIR